MLRHKLISRDGDICTVYYYPENESDYGIIVFSLATASPISHDPRGIKSNSYYLHELAHLRKCASGERDVEKEFTVAWY